MKCFQKYVDSVFYCFAKTMYGKNLERTNTHGRKDLYKVLLDKCDVREYSLKCSVSGTLKILN